MPPDSPHDENPEPESVFAALNDSACREILAAIGGPMTAKEISERTNIPLSTVYRKLDRLESAAMLEDRTKVDPGGNHRSQYVITFDGLYVELDDENRLRIEINPAAVPPDDRLAKMWSQVRGFQ